MKNIKPLTKEQVANLEKMAKYDRTAAEILEALKKHNATTK